jgi:hypothetical protein
VVLKYIALASFFGYQEAFALPGGWRSLFLGFSGEAGEVPHPLPQRVRGLTIH